MCISCRTLKEKSELVRVVMCDGAVTVDETGRANGRGAYVCKSIDCINKAKKANMLSKAFKCRVDSSAYDILAARYGQN